MCHDSDAGDHVSKCGPSNRMPFQHDRQTGRAAVGDRKGKSADSTSHNATLQSVAVDLELAAQLRKTVKVIVCRGVLRHASTVGACSQALLLPLGVPPMPALACSARTCEGAPRHPYQSLPLIGLSHPSTAPDHIANPTSLRLTTPPDPIAAPHHTANAPYHTALPYGPRPGM